MRGILSIRRSNNARGKMRRVCSFDGLLRICRLDIRFYLHIVGDHNNRVYRLRNDYRNMHMGLMMMNILVMMDIYRNS